jgi:hypothetical protein
MRNVFYRACSPEFSSQQPFFIQFAFRSISSFTERWSGGRLHPFVSTYLSIKKSVSGPCRRRLNTLYHRLSRLPLCLQELPARSHRKVLLHESVIFPCRPRSVTHSVAEQKIVCCVSLGQTPELIRNWLAAIGSVELQSVLKSLTESVIEGGESDVNWKISKWS